MTQIPYETIREKLSGHRALLVGGAGFIGHNLALQLRQLGVETMVVDNNVVNNVVDNLYTPDRNTIQRRAYQGFLDDRYVMMRDAGVHMRNVDARLFIDLMQVFDEFQPTKIVHLSAISSAVDARKNPGLCFDLQLLTLRNVLELCRSRKPKIDQIMLLSSSTVYGDFEEATVDETTRPRPRGIYANAKYMAERLVRTYRDQYDIDATIIRPSALYGERCISRRVSQVFIENALTGKPLLLEGGGDGRLDFTDINDLIDGMVRAIALTPKKDQGYTFNITYGNARTIAELAAVVRAVIPKAILEDRPRANDKPIRGTLSIERAKQMLGFYPKSPLEAGYRRYCEWYVNRWEKAGTSRS